MFQQATLDAKEIQEQVAPTAELEKSDEDENDHPDPDHIRSSYRLAGSLHALFEFALRNGLHAFKIPECLGGSLLAVARDLYALDADGHEIEP